MTWNLPCGAWFGTVKSSQTGLTAPLKRLPPERTAGSFGSTGQHPQQIFGRDQKSFGRRLSALRKSGFELISRLPSRQWMIQIGSTLSTNTSPVLQISAATGGTFRYPKARYAERIGPVRESRRLGYTIATYIILIHSRNWHSSPLITCLCRWHARVLA